MKLKLVIPKGRIYEKVAQLLLESGVRLTGSARNYRPSVNDESLEVKLLKSQNIPPLVSLGQHDIGFAGLDWVKEQNSEVEVLEDLGFDPVKIIAAIPDDWDWEAVKKRKIIAVSEYDNLCKAYLDDLGVNYTFVHSYGATEVFPPEDADLVVDNTSTGSTLIANRLKIIDTIMTSSTCIIANPKALEDPNKKPIIENLLLLIRSVMQGRQRVLLEMNCAEDRVDTIVSLLPAMHSPTVSKLYKSNGYSVKAAIKQEEVRELIPKLITAGAADILETPISKVV
ncbi:MAG: ATP phosphoribosyltransferase [Pseudomonadota bacterium]